MPMEELSDLYRESVDAYKGHIRLTLNACKDLRSLPELRRAAIEEWPEDKVEIERQVRSIFAKQTGWCIGLFLSIIPLTALFSINAMIHYLGLAKSVAFLGMAVGTTVWVFFLDRGSVTLFAIANSIGVLGVAGLAILLAVKDNNE